MGSSSEPLPAKGSIYTGNRIFVRQLIGNTRIGKGIEYAAGRW
jgi:hypothetical protein